MSERMLTDAELAERENARSHYLHGPNKALCFHRWAGTLRVQEPALLSRLANAERLLRLVDEHQERYGMTACGIEVKAHFAAVEARETEKC